jgi:hypothetical protein
MSIESIKQIVARAVTDAEYCFLLFNRPVQALAGYKLTRDELSVLTGLTPEASMPWPAAWTSASRARVSTSGAAAGP